MTLAEKIKSNPYLKIGNCTDVSDLEHAIDCLRKLDQEFGSENKTLLRIWKGMLDKKKRLEAANSLPPDINSVLEKIINKVVEIANEQDGNLEKLNVEAAKNYPEVNDMYSCTIGYYHSIARHAWGYRAKKIMALELYSFINKLKA